MTFVFLLRSMIIAFALIYIVITLNTFYLLLDSWIQDGCTLDLITLKHPGTNKKSLFIFNKQNEIQEVMTFGEPKRSWFINDSVTSNGNLYLSSPIDPLFLSNIYFTMLAYNN